MQNIPVYDDVIAADHQISQSLRGQRVGIIISGGDMDIERYCTLLAKQP
ncbi:hypothetical protein [Photorhabdus sp. CRCIA-P01]|nr:hypothetical protein [Photorhabdus sp. CRCIA-P01]